MVSIARRHRDRTRRIMPDLAKHRRHDMAYPPHLAAIGFGLSGGRAGKNHALGFELEPSAAIDADARLRHIETHKTPMVRPRQRD